jgi:hypothetical protein
LLIVGAKSEVEEDNKAKVKWKKKKGPQGEDVQKKRAGEGGTAAKVAQ